LLFDRRLVELLGRALLDNYRVLRTFPQAVAQAVAKVLSQQAGLAVNDANRALGTTRHAQPAAVALVFIYPDDLPRWQLVHRFSSPRSLRPLREVFLFCSSQSPRCEPVALASTATTFSAIRRPHALTYVNSAGFMFK
jgi:hypothetical protein